MSQRLWVCLALVLGASLNAHAQTSPSLGTPGTSSSLTRAQVLEDLKQWHAAGMTHVAHPSGYSDARESVAYQRYLQAVAAKQARPMTESAQTASSQLPELQP